MPYPYKWAGFFPIMPSLVSTLNTKLADITNDGLEDYTTVTSDTTLGTITLHLYKNGMKLLYLSVPNMAASGYTTGYIIPEKYRSKFPNGCIVPASTWTNGIPRRVAMGSDGRLQVSAGQETGLYCVGVYI